MSLWVAVDDSLQSDELLAGAGAAALAALAAEIASHQAATRLEIRASWFVRARRPRSPHAGPRSAVPATRPRTVPTRHIGHSSPEYPGETSRSNHCAGYGAEIRDKSRTITPGCR
jgi:hypothetical protein